MRTQATGSTTPIRSAAAEEVDAAEPGQSGRRSGKVRRGRRIAIGCLAGLILLPLVIAAAAPVIDRFSASCIYGGGEGRIACAYFDLFLIMISLPLGAVIGAFAGFWSAKRAAKRLEVQRRSAE